LPARQQCAQSSSLYPSRIQDEAVAPSKLCPALVSAFFPYTSTLNPLLLTWSRSKAEELQEYKAASRRYPQQTNSGASKQAALLFAGALQPFIPRFLCASKTLAARLRDFSRIRAILPHLSRALPTLFLVGLIQTPKQRSLQPLSTGLRIRTYSSLL